MSEVSAGSTHTATIEWRDQGPLFATQAEATGLSYLRGLISGDVVAPPVAQVLGIEVVKADPGRVQFTMPVKNFFTNHLGLLAGGFCRRSSTPHSDARSSPRSPRTRTSSPST